MEILIVQTEVTSLRAGKISKKPRIPCLKFLNLRIVDIEKGYNSLNPPPPYKLIDGTMKVQINVSTEILLFQGKI